jgi:hypothetical protein
MVGNSEVIVGRGSVAAMSQNKGSLHQFAKPGGEPLSETVLLAHWHIPAKTMRDRSGYTTSEWPPTRALMFTKGRWTRQDILNV